MQKIVVSPGENSSSYLILKGEGDLWFRKRKELQTFYPGLFQNSNYQKMEISTGEGMGRGGKAGPLLQEKRWGGTSVVPIPGGTGGGGGGGPRRGQQAIPIPRERQSKREGKVGAITPKGGKEAPSTGEKKGIRKRFMTTGAKTIDKGRKKCPPCVGGRRLPPRRKKKEKEEGREPTYYSIRGEEKNG